MFGCFYYKILDPTQKITQSCFFDSELIMNSSQTWNQTYKNISKNNYELGFVFPKVKPNTLNKIQGIPRGSEEFYVNTLIQFFLSLSSCHFILHAYGHTYTSFSSISFFL